MSEYLPKIPVSMQIRKIIFDNYNDIDAPFTNDGIFEILQSNGDLNPAWIVDDIEPHVNEICDSGMARNIAQNFTTVWLKLFDIVKKYHCKSCDSDIFLGGAEDRKCPNPSCGAGI